MPICPFCGEEMVPERVECSDGSGWMFGWACGCDEVVREGYEGGELIVYTKDSPTRFWEGKIDEIMDERS